MKEKILNETTSFCNECLNKEHCIESDCVLFRIEQIVLEEEKSKEQPESAEVEENV